MTTIPRTAARSRPGFTIVELLVAVMLLSVGVLALASTAAVTQRQMSEGSTRNRAASVAQSRFEVIASRRRRPNNCDLIVPVGGTVSRDSTRRGIREQWTITRPTNDGTVRVVDRLTLPRVAGVMTFESVVRCA